MGALLSKFWALWGRERHKLIIVGLDNAGKTTILYQFLLQEVVVTSPTIGSNVEEVVYKNLHFLMWDVGGQEALRESWSTYYSGAKGLIMVVDSTDSERIGQAKDEFVRMLAHEDLKEANVLIFANKQDVPNSLTAAEISKELSLSALKTHSHHIQPCCALTGEGLMEGMEWLSQQVKR